MPNVVDTERTRIVMSKFEIDSRTYCRRRFHLSPVDLSKRRRRRPRKQEKTSPADARTDGRTDGRTETARGEMQRPERGQINVKVIGLSFARSATAQAAERTWVSFEGVPTKIVGICFSSS